jgi:hypothetical protein
MNSFRSISEFRLFWHIINVIFGFIKVIGNIW